MRFAAGNSGAIRERRAMGISFSNSEVNSGEGSLPRDVFETRCQAIKDPALTVLTHKLFSEQIDSVVSLKQEAL